jgi:diphosphomevalonate decarboxylase
VKKSDVVKMIFHKGLITTTQREKGLAFAPTNIALCKYWGKRDLELNLPMTSSLSIALPDKGALTTLTLRNEENDLVILNDKELLTDSLFVQRIKQFLDLFRPEKKWHVRMDIKMNIPVAVGLASSACGFASLALALNDLFDWNLAMRDLSILARLGSGSASRSLWKGFVEWHAGVQSDGMDSYAAPLDFEWPDLRVGILSMSEKEKSISSRAAMQHTVDSSSLYASWPKKVARDLVILRQALQRKNFSLLGGTSESNALAMHATMLSSWPPVCYFLPETIAAMQQIWDLRRNGLEVYFTQDAGPNLKLLFLEKDQNKIKEQFPQLEVVKLFE